MKRAALLLAALPMLAAQSCATAMEPDAPQDEPAAGTNSSSGVAGHAGTNATSGGNGAAGTAARGGSSSGGTASGAGGNGSGGRSISGGNGSTGGTASGGVAGTMANAGTSTGGTASGGAAMGGSAAGGSVNQGGGAACDPGAATVLSAMSSNTAVKSDACLSIQIPADQTWIKKVTLQPEGATYPLPFTWSNCGTSSSGAFSANYANFVLDSVTSQCPILIKLGGSGTSFNVQWWGG